jgi:phosphoribosylglycinamide formyltransferase-1
MTAPLGIATLLSGEGRSILNLADKIRTGELDAEIRVVIAHDASLAGVARCREIGLEVCIVTEPDAEACSDAIDEVLQRSQAELICLCGYLRRFRVGELWSGRVVNIHPALLPEFGGRGMYGRRVHEAVLDTASMESGCTVHWVDEEYDRGPIILQERCEVRQGDDIDSLSRRVFDLECSVYPRAIEHVASKLRRSADMCES